MAATEGFCIRKKYLPLTLPNAMVCLANVGPLKGSGPGLTGAPGRDSRRVGRASSVTYLQEVQFEPQLALRGGAQRAHDDAGILLRVDDRQLLQDAERGLAVALVVQEDLDEGHHAMVLQDHCGQRQGRGRSEGPSGIQLMTDLPLTWQGLEPLS